MITKLANGDIELRDIPIRTREHHGPLHRRQHEDRQRAAIHVLREPRSGIVKAPLDRIHPCGEVCLQSRAYRRIGLVQLEREAPDRATVGATCRTTSSRYFASSANTRSIGSATSFHTGASNISLIPSWYMSSTASRTSCLPGKT